MKIENLQPDQVVYSAERRNMGNTTMKTTSVYTVRIVEVDPEKQWVLASRNGNPPRKFLSRSVSKWRVNKPVLISNGFGCQRLATRDEIKTLSQQGERRDV